MDKYHINNLDGSIAITGFYDLNEAVERVRSVVDLKAALLLSQNRPDRILLVLQGRLFELQPIESLELLQIERQIQGKSEDQEGKSEFEYVKADPIKFIANWSKTREGNVISATMSAFDCSAEQAREWLNEWITQGGMLREDE